MPSLPPHACANTWCPNLAPHGQSTCAPCGRKREQARGSAAARGYGRKWQGYRKRFLAKHPLCEPHLAMGQVVPATVVDHKKPHKGDLRLFWDPENHRASCKPCHDARVDEGDFGRAVPAPLAEQE